MLSERNGKKISKIESLKDGYAVYFDDEKIIVSKKAYEQIYLFVGKELSDEEISNLIQLTSVTNGLEYAIKLLSKKRYSEMKIKEKLVNKNFNSLEINIIINDLKSKNLINDNAYAKEMIDYMNLLNYGKFKILNKLKNEGLIINALENFSDGYELLKANNQIEKLNNKYLSSSYVKKIALIRSSLVSLGFDESTIEEAIKNVDEIDEENELENLEKEFKLAILRLENKYDVKLLKEKIIKSLMGKGFDYNDILIMWEEYENEINR
ncbi:MAG: RecX family transcriptional regulator [Bacilli bacterium]|nr:RecX family transcriptional regulator [Bacilli bacterium]